jgi:hypothetical protein
MVSLIQSRPTVTRHGIGVARHHLRPAIGFASRYRWSASANALRSSRSVGSNSLHAMRPSTSLRRNWTLMHVIPRRRRSRYQRIRRAPAETTGTLSEVMLFSNAGRFEPNAMTAFTLKLFPWVICKPRRGSFQTSRNRLAILNQTLSLYCAAGAKPDVRIAAHGRALVHANRERRDAMSRVLRLGRLEDTGAHRRAVR